MTGAHPHLRHVPVLLREAIETLAPARGETVIDCTAGLGGHAAAMAQRIGPTGTLVLFDLDPLNLEVAARRIRALPDAPRVIAQHASFADAPRLIAADGLAANVVLADLGFASPQVEDPARGFSFMRDGPLDMRLDTSGKLGGSGAITAAELVNTMPEQDLAELIRDLGEEPPAIARSIAAKVVRERRSGPIQTTARLAEIIRAASPAGRAERSAIHPATKTFQALRIAVNDEIGNLERLLEGIRKGAAALAGTGKQAAKPPWLAPGARIGIISFHSLEDRPVKQKFAELVDGGLAEHLTRKPVTAGDEEVAANPRSRSAKFRAIRLKG